MSNGRPESDPTGINTLFETMRKMSEAHRPFGVEVRFDGTRFSGQVRIIGLQPHEINLDPLETRKPPVPEIPTVPKTVHRK